MLRSVWFSLFIFKILFHFKWASGRRLKIYLPHEMENNSLHTFDDMFRSSCFYVLAWRNS